MASWPTVTDDDGTGTTGTVIDKTLTDAIKAYVDQPDGTAFIFNPAKADLDYTIKAAGTDAALVVQGSEGKVGIGTAVIPHGAIGLAKFALEGTNVNAHGPHIQITTSADDYPLLQILNWQHDDIRLYFDAYHDTGEKSSDAGSNYAVWKQSDVLKIIYDSGIAQGAAITWNDGIILDTTGLVTIAAAKLAVGATTPSAVQWGMLGAGVEWTDWTPTLTGDADLSAYDGARYFRMGDMCFFQFKADNKTVDTAGAHIQITLPFTAANTAVNPLMTGQVNNGAAWIGLPYIGIDANTNYVQVFKSAARGAWAGTEAGVFIRMSGFFEIA